MNNQLAIFEQKDIRRVEHEGEVYFSIIDFIGVLTDSPSPKTYWAKLKTTLKVERGQLFPNTERLKMKSEDGKQRLTECANTEGVLRILMTVPSPKAEPFKLWLSQASQKGFLEAQKPISKNSSYDALIDKIGQLWLKGRKKAANLVANVLVMTHWEIGQNIVEYEQNGNEKAEYGTKLFDKIARDLFAKHGRTFSRSTLIYIRKFYLIYPSIGESNIHQLSWTQTAKILRGLKFIIHNSSLLL
jgi:prophage antirepressor-like protein